DQNVDAAKLLLGLTDCVNNLGAVGDVEREWEDAVCVAFGEVGDLSDVAGGDDCAVTCGNDGLGQSAAQSGRASGDKPGGHVISHLLVVADLVEKLRNEFSQRAAEVESMIAEGDVG